MYDMWLKIISGEQNICCTINHMEMQILYIVTKFEVRLGMALVNFDILTVVAAITKNSKPINLKNQCILITQTLNNTSYHLIPKTIITLPIK